MKNMVKMNELDWDNILEPKEKMPMSQNVDATVLAHAQEYNVDLDSLETVSPADEKKTKNPDTLHNDIKALADMDIKLSDMINSVFNVAEYPVFIIQDDVLIYANYAVSQQLGIDISKITGRPFLELVDRQDWNLLAENIGEMLTGHRRLSIRFILSKQGNINMNLQAIYLPDIEHFSFILIGEVKAKPVRPIGGVLYDDKTGLPSFFLFEDRLQMALLGEHAKENPDERRLTAVVGINIDNIEDFAKLNLAAVVLKKTADNLAFNLPKTITVAIGLKYHFWLLINGLKNEFELDFYLRRIKEIMDAGIHDNFMHHDLLYSGGVSIAPKDAQTAKKMIEHTIESVRLAQVKRDNSFIIYNEKK